MTAVVVDDNDPDTKPAVAPAAATKGTPIVKPPVPVEGTTTAGEEVEPNANDDDEEGAGTGTVEVAAMVVVVATAVAPVDDDPKTIPDVVPAAAANGAPNVKPPKAVLLLLPLPVEAATATTAAIGGEGTGA